MPQYVAFLRAINVGGRVVKMEALRRVFETTGCSDVQTVIASGNVVFRSPARAGLRRDLEKGLRAALGFDVAAFLRTPRELITLGAALASDVCTEGNVVYVAFLNQALDVAAARTLRELKDDINEFRVCGREVLWLCRKTMSASGLTSAQLEKALCMPTTLRNSTTIQRIVNLIAANPGGRA